MIITKTEILRAIASTESVCHGNALSFTPVTIKQGELFILIEATKRASYRCNDPRRIDPMSDSEMQALQLLLDELESHQLHTILVPLNPRLRNWNEGGCKRVNADVPPAWYRRLCREYSSSRGTRRGKQDTKIRRQNILQVLRRLAKTGKPMNKKYDAELMAIARERAKKSSGNPG